MAARIFVSGDRNWALVVGSDMNNSDAGLTLLYQRKPEDECDGISTAWRHVWRLNVRWPITLRHTRPKSFPGRFRNHEVVKQITGDFTWADIRTASEIESERLARKKA